MSENNMIHAEIWNHNDSIIIALLALSQPLINIASITKLLNDTNLCQDNGRSFTTAAIKKSIDALQILGHVTEQYDGITCSKDFVWPAISNAIKHGFHKSLLKILKNEPRGNTYRDYYVASMARLRVALLSGDNIQIINHWIDQAENFSIEKTCFPFSDTIGNVFYPEITSLFCLEAQSLQASIFLRNIVIRPKTAPDILLFTPKIIEKLQDDREKKSLTIDFSAALMLCGKIEEADNLLLSATNYWTTDYLQAESMFLRGKEEDARCKFELFFKEKRKADKKRNIVIHGLPSYLYVIATIQTNDVAKIKKLDKYVQCAINDSNGSTSNLIYGFLQLLLEVNINATSPPEKFQPTFSKNLLVQLFQALVLYWLDMPELGLMKDSLILNYKESHLAGLDWLAAQFASILAAMTNEPVWAERALELQAKHGFTDATGWIVRKKAWQRQLAALVEIGKDASLIADKASEQRLVWEIEFDNINIISIEPREQKRANNDEWSKGRSVSLKRLIQDIDSIEYLNAHDRRALAVIQSTTPYGDPAIFYFSMPKIIDALVGHPLVFRADEPLIRIELVRQMPEINIERIDNGNQIEIKMNPPIFSSTSDVLITKETPTRVRVLSISDEHRRIGAIIGHKLTLPEESEAEILQMIKEISTLVTVHSSIDGSAHGVEQRDADSRIHAHLLPHQSGLRVVLLVRPIENAGPYFTPGHGGARIIIDVGGKPVQARRDLYKEFCDVQSITERCSVLTTIPQANGEWTVDSADDCLDLLLQLQDIPTNELIVAWPEGQKFKIGKRVGAGQFHMSIKSDRDWFAAGGHVQIDEQRVLDLSQLLTLVRQSNGRFVNLGNNEFLALTESFQKHLANLALVGDVGDDSVRLHPLSVASLQELIAEVSKDGQLETDQNWHSHIERMEASHKYEAMPPITLLAELRDYQLTGFRWLARLAHWGVGACLADDMGLGKTIQALALLLHRAEGGPALVIAPTSVCINWHAEVVKFAPTLKIRELDHRNRADVLTSLEPSDIVITTYGLLQQDVSLFSQVDWHTIVLDEAQAIKNSATKRSQAVMALKGDFKMAVSGTPIENHIGELFNLFKFINPGLLGSQESFNKRFAAPLERDQGSYDATSARARLRLLIQPFILRRTKAEVLTELPSRTEITIPIELSEQERALYETLRRTAVEKIASAQGPAGQAAIQALAELMKLRRACCNPNLVAPELSLVSSKLNTLTKLLEELLENKHKVLIFSQFVDHLGLIKTMLDEKAIQYQYLDGSTPPSERKRRVTDFQNGQGDVFLISLKAGGVGINLTAADYVVHMDPWWNPAVEDQASDRAHRMGQLRPVTIYRLVAEHTIEEAIVELHKQKRDLADSLLEGSDTSAAMSAKEIVAMLTNEVGR